MVVGRRRCRSRRLVMTEAWKGGPVAKRLTTPVHEGGFDLKRQKGTMKGFDLADRWKIIIEQR